MLTISEETGKILDQVAEHVKALAESLKVPAEAVFEILTKQQVYEGYATLAVHLAFFLLMGGIVAAAFYIEAKLPEKLSYDDVRRDVFVGIGVVGTLVFGINLIVLCLNFSGAFTQIYNPEYHAIKSILSMVK